MPETWKIDIEAGTVTHSGGWVFKFSREPDGYTGVCVTRPEPFNLQDALVGARIAREAGDRYLEALRLRH